MPALAPEGPKCYIRVGWLIDGSGNGPEADVLLEIQAENIVSIRRAEASETHGQALIDLSGHTVLPVLVDSHVHLCLSGSADPILRAHQPYGDYDTARMIIQRHLASHLACGITAVRDAGDRHGHVARYKGEQASGSIHQVHLGTAGKAWHACGRYGGLIGRPPDPASGLAADVLEHAGDSDYIKLVNSGLNSLKSYGHQTAAQFEADELRQTIAVAKKLGRKVMVHANGRLPVQMAVQAGCDSIEHGFFMGPENLALMAEKQVTWVPTAVTMQAYAEAVPAGSRQADVARKNLDHQLEQIRQAKSLGVKVAAGTDAGSPGVHHGVSLALEIRLLVAAGYGLAEALRCSSSHGADLLSLGGRGRLAPGRRADFIVVRGRPAQVLEGLARPEWVCLAGRKLDGPAGEVTA